MDSPDTPEIGNDELGLDNSASVDLTDDAIDDSTPATIDIPAEDITETVVEPSTTATTTSPYTGGSGFRWSLVFGSILVVGMIILVFQNNDPTTFNFLMYSITAPLSVIIIGTILVAVIIDEIVGYIIRVRRRRVRRQLAELKELKSQLAPPKQRLFGRKAK